MHGLRSIRDYQPSLRRAISAARAAGLGPEADRPERAASIALLETWRT